MLPFNWKVKQIDVHVIFGSHIQNVCFLLSGFFEEVASPLLNDVRFVYQGNEVDEVTESRVPNYFGGSEFVVAGRLKNSDSLSGNINATSAEGVYYDYFDFRLPPLLPEIPSKNITKKEASFSLEKIWAYLTIQDLLKQRGADTKDSSNITAKALRLSLSVTFNNIWVFRNIAEQLCFHYLSTASLHL